MDNETPLQKTKLKEFNELLEEKPKPVLNNNLPKPLPTAGTDQESHSSLNDLVLKRTQEEISAFINLNGFLYSTLDSLRLAVEKNEKAIEEYRQVIQNNVIEEFEKGNIDWRFYSAFVNNKMSLWIGGAYLIAMPIFKGINDKKKANAEKLKENLNNITDIKDKQNKQPKDNKFDSGSLKDNISKQYN